MTAPLDFSAAQPTSPTVGGIRTPSRSDLFYSSIEPVAEFERLTDIARYRPLPDDWWVALADVVDSTEAIERGEYKAVNTVGVSVIAAITNVSKPVELPYVFGGDGAIVCVPGSAADDARRAMASTAAMAKVRFGLTLRLALVPVRFVRSRGDDILVGRHRLSPHMTQCALFGGGVASLEKDLKSGRLPEEYIPVPDASSEADYSGLECRWEEVPSPEEETVALIVSAVDPGEAGLAEYREVLDRIRVIYGDAEKFRPVREEGLRVTLSSAVLANEERVRTWGKNVFGRIRYAITQRVLVVVGWYFFLIGKRTSSTDWGRYRSDLVANTDYRKLDGMLRLVLSGTVRQRNELESYLAGTMSAGRLRYGIHVAHSALMTCLVSQRQFDHLHFVDAAGGGYAAAAKAMKL